LKPSKYKIAKTKHSDTIGVGVSKQSKYKVTNLQNVNV